MCTRLLYIKLESKVITSNGWVCTAAAAPSIVTLTVIRHLRDKEEVVAVDIDFQTCETELLNPALGPRVSYFHILQTEVRAVEEILCTIIEIYLCVKRGTTTLPVPSTGFHHAPLSYAVRSWLLNDGRPTSRVTPVTP